MHQREAKDTTNQDNIDQVHLLVCTTCNKECCSRVGLDSHKRTHARRRNEWGSDILERHSLNHDLSAKDYFIKSIILISSDNKK